MGKRKSEAGYVVEFFSTAPLDAAEAILSVAQQVVKRRRAEAGGKKSGGNTKTPGTKVTTASATPPNVQAAAGSLTRTFPPDAAAKAHGDVS